MRKLYSYSRVSSEQQLKGVGLSRQKDNAEAYANKYGYQLKELVDAGVSGFKEGRNNLSHGELGKFIAAIQAGKIEEGSILMIENLDRLGRHGISVTQTVVGSIISGGVEIHVVEGDVKKGTERIDIYSVETMNEIGPAVQLAVNAHTAWKQSADKQNRQRVNWEKKREAVKRHGTLMTKNVPKWLKVVGDSIMLPEENLTFIERMVELYLNHDLGMSAIVQRMQNEGFQTFFKSWNTGTYNFMMRSRALTGHLVLRDGTVIPEYFPAAMDVDTFNQIQAKIKERGKKNGRKGGSSWNSKNLFRGFAVCARCGDHVHLKTITYGGRCKDRQQLQCANTLCKHGSWEVEAFEQKFFEFVKNINLEEIFSDNGEASKIAKAIQSKRGELVQVEEQIKNATKLAVMTGEVSEVAEQINQLNSSRIEIELVIEELERQIANLETVNTSIEYDDVRSMSDDQRQAVRAHLSRLISEVQIYTTKRVRGNKGKAFKVFWKNGKESWYACELDGTEVINAQMAHDHEMPLFEYNVDTEQVRRVKIVEGD